MRYLFEDREGDQGLPGSVRRIATLALLVFTTMVMLDTSLVSIALPTIARDLRISESQSVWVVSTYQLVTAISILTFSALGAMLGFRRLFIGGVLVFTAASLGCALSTSFILLLSLRFVQGLGAAAAMCVTAALYGVIFPRRLLGSALGINAFVVGGVMAVGPTLGGAIVSVLPWPWIFAIDVPLGVVALWFVWSVLPRESARAQAFDIAGAITSALAVGCLLLGMYALGRPAGLHISVLFLAGAAVSALVFVHVQRTVARPLLALDIFQNERVALATVTSIIANVGQGIALVALPFLFQGRYGLSPVASGLLFTPMPMAIMVAAPLSGWFADRYGAAPVATGGLAALTLGYAILGALDPVSVSIHQIALGVFVCGFGFGLFQTPNNREFIGTVDRARLANASGLLTFSRLVGLTLGTVVAALVALIATPGVLGSGRVPAAHHVSLWLAAGAAMLATMISALRLKRQRAALP